MSYPENPLAAFRTYSYYHVMAICDTTETAEALAKYQIQGSGPDVVQDNDATKAADITRTWLHGTTDYEKLYEDVKTIDIGNGQQGKYIILINNSTDANFVITNFKWTSYLGSFDGEANTMLSTTGSIRVSEPRNIQLLDQLIKCCQTLGIEFAYIPCVMKTFFVGYKYGDLTKQPGIAGKTVYETNMTNPDNVELLANIPGFPYTITNVNCIYTETGGVYDFDIVSIANGLAEMPQFSTVVDTISIGTVPANRPFDTAQAATSSTSLPTLKNVIALLESEVNRTYRQNYQCAINIMKNKYPDVDKTYGPIEYKFIVEAPYDSDEYLVIDSPTQTKDTTNCVQSPKITFTPRNNIQHALTTIINFVPKIKEEASKQRLLYQIHNKVETRVENETLYTTVYYVIRRSAKIITQAEAQTNYEQIDRQRKQNNNIPQNQQNPNTSKIPDNKLFGGGDQTIKGIEEVLDAGNFLIFDYIYSGLNTDVLSYDMRIAAGIGFLGTAVTGTTLKDPLDPALQKVIYPNTPTNLAYNRGAQQENNEGVAIKTTPLKMPLFAGKQLLAYQNRNTQSPTTNLNFQTQLHRWAAIENIQATLKITGNTDLLGSLINATMSVTEPLRTKNRLAANAQADNNVPVNVDWSKFPSLIKVNVYMPSSNDDLELYRSLDPDQFNKTSQTVNYANKFWYDGFYRVLSIDNEFNEDGSFTQLLNLIALPVEPPGEEKNPGAAVSEFDINKCFEVTNNGPIPPKQPEAVPSQKIDEEQIKQQQQNNNQDQQNQNKYAQPTNWREAKAYYKQVADTPAQVIGYEEKAKPEWKSGIAAASSRFGVSERSIAMMAAHESAGWQERAKPITKSGQVLSSAQGLGQFLDSTWMEMYNKGYIPRQYTEGKNRDQILELRNQGEVSAYMIGAFMDNNRKVAAGKGVTLTDVDDFYLCHWMGPGGGVAILKNRGVNGSKKAVDAFVENGISAKQWYATAAANKLSPDATVDEVADKAALYMARKLKQTSSAGVATAANNQNASQPQSTNVATEQAIATNNPTTNTENTGAGVVNKYATDPKQTNKSNLVRCGDNTPLPNAAEQASATPQSPFGVAAP